MRPKYKHMSPYESALFDEFRFREGENFIGFAHDVRVGEGYFPDTITDQKYRDLAIKLTQKRIDAVGHKNNSIWIIEVKPNAALSALGQLIAYRDLYVRQFFPRRNITLAIVSDFISPDDEFLFSKHGILIYKYPQVRNQWSLGVR